MPLTAAITGFQRSFSFGLMLIPGSLYWNGVDTGPVWLAIFSRRSSSPR